jgi:hypothetical protein
MKNIIEELKYMKEQNAEIFEKKKEEVINFCKNYPFLDKDVQAKLLYLAMINETEIFRDLKSMLDDPFIDSPVLKKGFAISMISDALEKLNTIKEVYVLFAQKERTVVKDGKDLPVRSFGIWWNNNLHNVVIFGDAVKQYNLEPDTFYEVSLTYVNDKLYPVPNPIVRKLNKQPDSGLKQQIQEYIVNKFVKLSPPLAMVADNQKTYWTMGILKPATPKSSILAVVFDNGEQEELVIPSINADGSSIVLAWGQIISSRVENRYAMLVQGMLVLKILRKVESETISPVYGDIIPPTKVPATENDGQNNLDDLPL